MSSTTCPVFRPSLEEFKNFRKYIRKLETESTCGICKVIPPEGWWHFDYAGLNLDKLMIPSPVRQDVSGRAGTFNVDLYELPTMSASQLKAIDARAALVEPSYAERERKFWRYMGVPHPQWEDPIYGADMSGSLFGDDEASSWNLNSLDSILTLIGTELPGITSSYMYIGMWRALFAFHCEDMDLYSVNFLHTGACKSWYSIPLAYKQRFESMAQSYFAEEYQSCHEFLRHKTKLFSPTKIKENGIELVTVLQEPGEFVVTFPGCYHAGFSHGFNIAEATNFATPSWLEIGRKAKRCICRPHSASIDINLLQTLWLRQVFAFKKPNESTFPKRMRCACGINALLETACKSLASNDESIFACSACYLWCHKRCIYLEPDKVVAPLLCHICLSLETEDWKVLNFDTSSSADNVSSTASSAGNIATSSSSSSSTSGDGNSSSGTLPEISKKRGREPTSASISIKSAVAVFLQGHVTEVFGIITDVEDGESGQYGRLHIKGKRKDLDVWVPLFDENIRLLSLDETRKNLLLEAPHQVKMSPSSGHTATTSPTPSVPQKEPAKEVSSSTD